MTRSALQDFEAALALTPGAASAAIADYTEAIRLDPELAVAFHNRGYEYELQNNLNAALADYRRALELSPQLKPAVEALQRVLGRTR